MIKDNDNDGRVRVDSDSDNKVEEGVSKCNDDDEDLWLGFENDGD